MKVLWFTNTPAGGDEVLKGGGTRGGWLASIDKAIRDKVELSVAFYFARFAEPFECNGVIYYPICRKNWKFNIVRTKLFGDYKDREDLPKYIEIIKKVQPDIIHIHGTENPFGCLISVIDVPIVISYQGSCTVYNHKFFSGIERKYALPWASELQSFIPGLDTKSYRRGFKKSCYSRGREIRNLRYCRNIIGRTDWDKRITRILSPTEFLFS